MWLSCRNISCTALKASASRAGGLVDVMIYVASGALDTSLCFDRCMYYPAEYMQTDIKRVSKLHCDRQVNHQVLYDTKKQLCTA